MSSIKPIRDPKTDHLLTPGKLRIVNHRLSAYTGSFHHFHGQKGAGGKYIQYLSCGQRIQCPCYIDYGECCHRP